MSPNSRSTSAPSRRLVRLALVASGALVVAGGLLFAYASQQGGARDESDGAVVVTVRDDSCDPDTLSVPAGRTSFRIVNASDRAVEWEILDGVMVLEERENIAPGISQTLSAKLPAGQFEITCGLLSNPRGTLIVTPSAQADKERAHPTLTAFIGPLAEYQVYLAMQANAFLRAASALDEAIRANDLERARILYVEARAPYSRIEPVAGRVSDLDNKIDPLPDYLAGRVQDPAFTGLHRLEYGLFSQNTTDGLASVSDKLVLDAGALKDRLRKLKLAPDDIGMGASRLAASLASTRIPAGEDRYSGTDLADIAANLEGIGKAASLLKPVADGAAPEAMGAVDSALTAANGELDGLRQAGAFPAYSAVDEAHKFMLADRMRELAMALERLNDAIGFGA